MAEQKIERIEDVRPGDIATMDARSGATVTGPVQSAAECTPGHGLSIATSLNTDGSANAGRIFRRPEWEFVSATREVPDVAPGTTGTATVLGTPNVRVMRVQPDDRAVVDLPWVSDYLIGGWFAHAESSVVDFVPDLDRAAVTAEMERLEIALGKARGDAEALRRDVTEARRDVRNAEDQADRWQDEAKRLRAALAEVRGDLETQVQITRDVRADANSLLQQKDQWYAAAVQAEAEATEHGDRPKRRFVCTVCGTERLTDGE